MALRFETVGLRFGKGNELLSDASFALGRGEVAVVTGVAGSGKSSLLALASLALAPSRGRICLFGHDASAMRAADRRAARRRIGLVGADDLVPALGISDNLALPLLVEGLNEAERRARIDGALTRIGLGARGGDRPTALSSVERRRLLIARALIVPPQLLLVDDVDRIDPEELPRQLRLLADTAARGAAVLATAADPRLAERMPDAIVLRLERGRLSGQAPAMRRGAA